MIAEADNLTQELTQEGRIVLEPSYLGFLRAEGYTIDSLEDIDTVKSESDPDKKYLVAEIQTFDKPKDHPNLDFVSDKLTLRVCSCWAWRSNSADLSDGENPSECGSCKHLKRWNREERAEQDASQTTITEP